MPRKAIFCGDKYESFETKVHQKQCRMALGPSQGRSTQHSPIHVAFFTISYRINVLNFHVFHYLRGSVQLANAKRTQFRS